MICRRSKGVAVNGEKFKRWAHCNRHLHRLRIALGPEAIIPRRPREEPDACRRISSFSALQGQAETVSLSAHPRDDLRLAHEGHELWSRIGCCQGTRGVQRHTSHSRDKSQGDPVPC
eukprot:9983913-Heterocapsa_arctica.AAC.1